MAMSDTPPTPRVTVREATPDDLGDVAALLAARDGQRRGEGQVADYLWHLDPAHTRAWIAHAGDRPVGLTMLYLRDLHWPSGEPKPILRAGYWAHLYVEPAFRKQMVYPQLVLAMIRGMDAAGLDLLYTGTRQADVAAGHQKLGFALVGRLPVRLRPLRPFRLLAKHRGLGRLAPLCGPLDPVVRYCTASRPPRYLQVEPLDLQGPAAEQLASLLSARPSNQVHQQWTAEQLRRRFRATLDGQPYRITGTFRDARLVAAAVTTLAVRGNGIRAGVLLELAAAAEATEHQVAGLLADAEQQAADHGAELVLALPDSLPAAAPGRVAGRYLATESEAYHLLVYPKSMVAEGAAAAGLQNWHFTFGDHDAF